MKDNIKEFATHTQTFQALPTYMSKDLQQMHWLISLYFFLNTLTYVWVQSLIKDM